MGFRHCYRQPLVLYLSLAFAATAPALGHAQQNRIGGSGGQPFQLQCRPGHHAVGMSARHDGRVINQLRLRCVAADPATGNWDGSPSDTAWSPTDRWQGTSGLETRVSTCPENEFIEPAVYGRTSSVGFATVVAALDWTCVRFREIDPSTGTSEKRRGGNFGVGVPVIAGGSERQLSRHGTTTDAALHVLNLRYGLAVDSVVISSLHMPWTDVPAARNRTPPRPSRRIGRSPAPQAGARPDLTVQLLSPLWRYSGETKRSRGTFRKVPEAFCATGMVRSKDGRQATRTFYLPDLAFRVRNSGSGSTGRVSAARAVFGNRTGNPAVPDLAPGERRDFSLARPRIRRCVTNGGDIGGCHECLGQSRFEDPRVRITADAANVIAESDERNNVIDR